MKQLSIITTLFLVLLCSFPLHAQHDVFIKDYLERLENSRNYLLLVAEDMPDDKYAFRATPESKSFAEHLMHISWALDWHSQSLLGGREARDWRTDTELTVADKSKEEMIAKVNSTFDKSIALIKHFEIAKLEEELDYFGLNRTKRQILLLLADHITHHRAQMLVSMRLNGLEPPRYILFQ